LGGRSIPARPQIVRPPVEDSWGRLRKAVERAAAAMLQLQRPEGYWWAELESNATITAEYIMLHRLLGLDGAKVPRMAADLLSRQLPNGGWSVWYGDGG